MRVVLVGPAHDRARLRSQLNGAAIDVVAEFPSLAAARAADVDADALLLAPADGVRLPPSPLRGFGAASKPGTTYEGEERTSRSPARDDADDIPEEPLTPREIQVLELLAEGLPNKAIATRLRISDQTVKFHVASIAGKLGAANRTDAVRRAVRRGLLTL